MENKNIVKFSFFCEVLFFHCVYIYVFDILKRKSRLMLFVYCLWPYGIVDDTFPSASEKGQKKGKCVR